MALKWLEHYAPAGMPLQDGTHFARYTVVTLDAVTKACLMPIRTSAQNAELIALVQAPQLTAEVQINIYMDLNMESLLPFMSMYPYIKKGGSLTQELKVLSMDKKVWNF
jgi:hypothetical protein